MKKNLYLTSLLYGFMACTTISCDDPGEPQFENDRYTSMLTLQHSGLHAVDFYNTNQEIVFTTSIGKGGTDPNIARLALLRPFTQEELDAYNRENLTAYKMLPADCYAYTTQYTFEAETERQQVEITLKPEIFLLGNKSKYALPLRLTSPVYGVNDDTDRLILVPNLITPALSLKTRTESFVLDENDTEATWFSTYVDLNTTNQGWEFSVELERDRQSLQTLVDQYSAETGTIYKLLPASGYTLPAEVEFSNSQDSSPLEISLKPTGLDKYVRYLLPVALKECSGMPFEINEKKGVTYLEVSATGELSPITLELSQMTSNEKFEENIDRAFSKIIDGDISSSWQTRWSNTQEPEMELPPFDRIYGIYIDIDNLNIKNVLQVKVASGTGHNKPTEWSLYKKDGSGSYTKLGNYEDTFPGGASEYTTEAFLTGECTGIRIAFTKSEGKSLTNPVWNAGGGCPNISIGEITVYGE